MIPRWNELRSDKTAYARRALANRHIDQLRHRGVRHAHQPRLATEHYVADSASGSAMRIDTIHAFEKLDLLTRSVLILRYLMDWTSP